MEHSILLIVELLVAFEVARLVLGGHLANAAKVFAAKSAAECEKLIQEAQALERGKMIADIHAAMIYAEHHFGQEVKDKAEYVEDHILSLYNVTLEEVQHIIAQLHDAIFGGPKSKVPTDVIGGGGPGVVAPPPNP